MEIIKKHKLAVAVSVFVGVIYIAPYIFFAYQAGGNYRGINITRTPDEEGYLTIANSLYQRGVVGDPYIFEYRGNGNSVNFYLVESLYAFGGRLLRLSVPDFSLAMKFIAPAILFIAVYLLAFALIGSADGAVFVSIFVLLGNEAARAGGSAISALFSGTVSSGDFLVYSRPVNPSVSSIVFFVVLFLILKLYRGEERFKSWIAAVGVGAAIGILSYFYFYFWAFLFILCGVVLLYALIIKNWMLVKSAFIAIFSSILTATVFLMNTLQLFMAPPANGSFGGPIQKAYINTHGAIFEKIILLPLCIFALLYLWQYLNGNEKISGFIKKYFFIILLLITGLIASNEQVITGIEIQQHHFHFFTNIPIFLIAIAVLIYGLSDIFLKRWKNFIIFSSVLFIVAYAMGIQASSYGTWKNDFMHYQDYAPIFSWLRANSVKDGVVYTDQVLSEMIPMYTQDYVYSSGHAAAYPVPVTRLSHNYFMELFLRGIKKDDALAYSSVSEHRDEMGQYVFEGQYWKDACGSYGCFPDSTFKSLVDGYISFLDNSFEENLKKYKVDYIIWDSNKDPEWNIGQYKFLKKVYTSDGISIFRVL